MPTAHGALAGAGADPTLSGPLELTVFQAFP